MCCGLLRSWLRLIPAFCPPYARCWQGNEPLGAKIQIIYRIVRCRRSESVVGLSFLRMACRWRALVRLPAGFLFGRRRWAGCGNGRKDARHFMGSEVLLIFVRVFARTNLNFCFLFRIIVFRFRCGLLGKRPCGRATGVEARLGFRGVLNRADAVGKWLGKRC